MDENTADPIIKSYQLAFSAKSAIPPATKPKADSIQKLQAIIRTAFLLKTREKAHEFLGHLNPSFSSKKRALCPK